MQTKRIIWFVIMIAAGIAIGLFYGWIIHPVKNVDTSASSLRADYKTDYVLMVAEIYQKDGDLSLAATRLGLISSQPPGKTAAEGLLTARSLGYTPADLSLIEKLSRALQKETPTPQIEGQP
ncbi:MAG: hypothetical protein IH586_10140 [Anaerolineaceae bacterium]|nr:hypothetical protein [Anaerolineaceae bacterium]